MRETLLVSGLSWKTDEDALRAAFAGLGPVARVRVLRDPLSGRTLGFGFVTLERGGALADSVQVVDGRPVRVRPALEHRADGVRGLAQADERYTWTIFEDGEESLVDRADPAVNLIDDYALKDVRGRLRDRAMGGASS